MRSDLVVSLVAGMLLILLVLLPRWWWRGHQPPHMEPKPTRPKRDPKPFAGLTRQPFCADCEPGKKPHPPAPGAPPPHMIFTRGRHRQVETTGHCCPNTTWSSHGWGGCGNIRANGHPRGRRGRQLVCLGCRGSLLETVGPPFPSKQVAPDTLVWAISALAAGLGIRAVARVFEGAPHTVLSWLIEAAEHLEAFSRSHVHHRHAEQGQMAALFALLRAVTEGEVTEGEAIQRLSRSPPWMWVALDPVCKLIVAVDVGNRPLAMAQRLVHQVTQVLAPECVPRFLTGGFRDSRTA